MDSRTRALAARCVTERSRSARWCRRAPGSSSGASSTGTAGRGLHTLLQASAVADRWGTRAFGRVNGVFSAPLTLSVALAPAGGVLVAGAVGASPLAFAVLGGLAVLAALLAAAT